MTWDDEFVGEVARTVKACKVFLFFPFYWLCESDLLRFINYFNNIYKATRKSMEIWERWLLL